MIEKRKSERHSKIAGDFGEHLICYWLSKRGFESAIIDYTGIDIIAYNNNFKIKRLGISVKTRTRFIAKYQKDVITIRLGEIPLIYQTCEFFNATPYLGIVVDQEIYKTIGIYILPFEKAKEINAFTQDKKNLYIKVSDKIIKQYETSENSIVIKMAYKEEYL